MGNQQRLFYVYQYNDPIKEKVFYIGKGTKNRAYSTNKNIYVQQRIKLLEDSGISFKDEVVEIIKYFDNSMDALEYEKQMIKHYGLENLLNMTSGGEGVCSEVAKFHALERSKKGVIFTQTETGKEFHRERIKDEINAGTFVLLKREDGSSVGGDISKKRILDGSHHFFSKRHSENMTIINNDKVNSGKHNFQSDVHKDIIRDSNARRIENGTHPFLCRDTNNDTIATRANKELVRNNKHCFQESGYHHKHLHKRSAYKGVCVREDELGNKTEFISIANAVISNKNIGVTEHSLRYRFINSNQIYKGYFWYIIK